MARTQSGTMSLQSKKARDVRRTVLVFSALAGSLTVTALVLQLLWTGPVHAQALISLSATDSPETITRTISQAAAHPWKYIYVHHSKTADGDAKAIAGGDLGDHFVICNGDGGADGEVQVGYRWTRQLPATPPRGAKALAPDCISVCVVGDFDMMRPTSAQMRRLALLVSSLQTKHDIPGDRVFVAEHGSAPAGIGKHFPIYEFRQRILVTP
jgi:N-acetylmuramoyl-L-alanine amidase